MTCIMTSMNDAETTLGKFVLPISGKRVTLRYPTGADDLLMLESPDDASLAVALAERLARPIEDETACDWSGLTVTDLDVLILRLRQAIFGDRVLADVPCSNSACGKRIDISFGIDQYIAHHIPAHPVSSGKGWRAEPSDEAGWFCLTATSDSVIEGEVLFRLPTAADQLAVAALTNAVNELVRRCIRPADVPARQRRRVEAAMEAMAPSLSRNLLGVCPECQSKVTVFFDARRYCLRELRDGAGFVYRDIDVLARRYHWAETDILALSRIRRSNYAEFARQEGAV